MDRSDCGDVGLDGIATRRSFVIARNTAFSYKGNSVDAKEIGRELSVRYLLEGSARCGRRSPPSTPASRNRRRPKTSSPNREGARRRRLLREVHDDLSEQAEINKTPRPAASRQS